MRAAIGLLLMCCAPLAWVAAWGHPVETYNVVWDSPSQDHHGSMPLGNGDIALNAWATQKGEIQFYIGKTDAWDDNARLLKVGKVRVRLEPNPFAEGRSYRQTLDLHDATLKIEAGQGGQRTTVRAWVDALHPVIHVEIESRMPLEATACVEIWRTHQCELAELQISDVMMNPERPDKKQAPTILEPDCVLAGQFNRIGWYHHNLKSAGPQELARLQGLTGFPQPDPLLHRIFGGILTAQGGERLDDLRLRSKQGKNHRFSVFVLSAHPSTPDQWLADMEATMRKVDLQPFPARRKAHEAWWREFWERSWIRANARGDAASIESSMVPSNTLPVRLGMDQAGGSKFEGELGRITLYAGTLTDREIALRARTSRDHEGFGRPGALYSGTLLEALEIPNSTAWVFPKGLTVECWVKPSRLPASGARLVDKITPGGSDGFLLDTFPGNSLRFICGSKTLHYQEALPAGQWNHVAAVADPAAGGCRLYVNGKTVASDAGVAVLDEAFQVSQMYHLQRFITACAGRGAYPIKFNGSLFTAPPGATEADPDYRRWGPGYWWQNTRLPYLSLCASGDFDVQRPLFRMYAEDLLPLCQYRTKLYLGHEGAFYPECIMFWGAIFGETYGWTPFEQRQDKLQESRWHKWEWVSGLELCWMMLDYYEHTLDRAFLQKTVLPFVHEILTFFDQHYPVDARGRMVMHPSQALETWWHCTNATPEVAGCHAVTRRLMELEDAEVSSDERAFWHRFHAKLPPIPLRDIQGRKALAPAEYFDQKSNVENPELYPVFPFRLFAFNRPNADWALAALEHRWDRGHNGWRQDDIFMAYLGLTDQVRPSVANRARNHDPGERFPAFWGPNFDWTPDQDHGGVLMKTFQSMLMQCDGKAIYLLPAWPKDWDVQFKLHAPRQTVVEGEYRHGKIRSLRVIPASRKADVTICGD